MMNRKKPTGRNRVYLEQITLKRAKIVLVVFCLCACSILVKSFLLQVVQHARFEEMAKKRHMLKVPLRKNRGAIYDRNEEPMAVTVETDSVYVRPKKLKDPEAAAKKVALALDMDVDYVLRKFKSDKKFVWLKRQAPLKEAALIREFDIEGIGMITEPDRSYPYGKMAGPLMGFTGVDLQGLAGLEAQFNGVMRGEGGVLMGERDALGKPLFPDGIVFENTNKGQSLRLTVDHNIQFYTDLALAEGFKATRAEGACAIVMDPFTGEVLAMSSVPGFDPNYADNYKRNICVSDVFEPGSTFKPFAMAAALDKGAVSVTDKIDCKMGNFRFGGHTIHDTHGHGLLLPEQIIKFSSNIGITQVAIRLGMNSWAASIADFGFGSRTKINLPGETAGIVRSVDGWRKIDIATSSFGQGISVTPLQLTTAFCSLVNGGNLMKPFVVSDLIEASGRTLEYGRPRIVRRVISQKTSEQITAMMALVTEEGGTATRAAIPGFSVVGKTGTAQKPENGGYSADKRIASFIGAVPAEDPEVVVLVLFDDPKGSQHEKYGGICAAPVFKKIAERTLQYRSRFAGKKADTPRLDIAALDKSSGSKPTSKPVKIDYGAGKMPDLAGMPVRKALKTAEKLGLDLMIVGSGVAVRQMPNPGTDLEGVEKGTVLFRPAH